MDTMIYIIAITVLGCEVVCGSVHKDYKGDLKKSFMNVLKPLAMVDMKESYKQILNEYPTSPYLRQYPNPDKATMDFYRPEIPKHSLELKHTKGRYKRMTSAGNLEDIFGTWSIDRKKQHERDLQSDLSKDPVLSANIEYVLGMASNTLDGKHNEYTIPNPLINLVEPHESFEKYSMVTSEKSTDETSTFTPQKTNLNSIIKNLYGPEVRFPYPETNDLENQTGDTSTTPKTPNNKASDLQASKLYALFALTSVLLLL